MPTNLVSPRRLRALVGALALAVVACADTASTERKELTAAPVPKGGAAKRTELGKNVYLEVKGDERRVIVVAKVVLREGTLEGLLTRAKTKEHEYILATACDARHIHLALIAAGAKPGAPVTFEPKYKPAHGGVLQVSLRYKQGGKTVTVPAKEWVREGETKKLLDKDWVFGGSRMVPNREGKGPPYYLANDGDLICLVNMESAMLDLPVKSEKALDSRIYQANTPKIPALDTEVEVIFEPAKKK